MKRRGALVALILGLGWAIALPGTIAPFIDVATGTGTLAAGIIDLQVSDANEDFTDNLVTHTWVLTDALPGDPATCGNVTLKNFGNRAGTSVSISVVNTGSGGPALAREVIITSLSYDGFSILGSVNGAGDGHADQSVRDLELQGGISGLSGLDPPPPFGTDGTKSFHMCLQLHADSPDALQGLTWLGTFSFTLQQ